MTHAHRIPRTPPEKMVLNPILKAALMLGCISMPWMATAQNSAAGSTIQGITNKALPMTQADSTATTGRALPASQTVCSTAGTVLSGGVCVPLPNTSVATCGTSPETSRVTPCPSGYTGTLSENRLSLCDNTTNYRWHMGPWTTTSSTCTAIPTQTTATLCGTSPETSQVSPCPTGFTGTVSENRTSLCTEATNYRWQMGPWTVTSSTCAAVPSGPGGVSCTSTPLSWTVGINTCSATAPQTYSGSGVTLSDNTSPTTGSATFTCNGGSWSAPASVSCTNTSTPPPTVTCPAITATNASIAEFALAWPSGCYATSNIPATAVGYTASATAASPCSGTANYACTTGGTWTWTSGSITPAPTPTCPTTNIPETSQTISCPAGQTGAITQTRTTSCNASTGWVWATGSWNTLVNTCTTPPPQACNAQTTTWMGFCSASLGYTPSGQTVTAQNAASGYVGSSSYACNNGSWTSVQGAQTCHLQTPPAPKTCEIVTGDPWISRRVSGGSGAGAGQLISYDAAQPDRTFYYAKTALESSYTEVSDGRAAFERGRTNGYGPAIAVTYKFRYTLQDPTHDFVRAYSSTYNETPLDRVMVCNSGMSAQEMYAANEVGLGGHTKTYNPFDTFAINNGNQYSTVENYLKSSIAVYSNTGGPIYTPDTISYEFNNGYLYFVATFTIPESVVPPDTGW